MQRYFFHSEDGHTFRDEEGTELPNDEAARIEAARVLGQMLNEHPADVWRHDQFRVLVADANGATLYILDLAAIRAPAAGGPGPGRQANETPR